jgi:hypothetical protein
VKLQNDDDLERTREEMFKVEDELLALRRDVLPESRERYEALAKPYRDQIVELRQRIEEYLGIPAIPPR